MKLLTKILKSKTGLYGMIISLLSVSVIVFTFLSKEKVLEEFERLKSEEGCFQIDKPDPDWGKMTPEERKLKTNKCMSSLNKVTQVKYSPYVFSVTLLIGVVMLIISTFSAFNKDDSKENDANELL